MKGKGREGKGREGKVVIRMIVLALIAVVANRCEAKAKKWQKTAT